MSLNGNHQSLYFFFLAPSPPRQAVLTFMAFYGTLKKKISIRVPFISFICVHIYEKNRGASSPRSLRTLWCEQFFPIRQYVTGIVDGDFLCGWSFSRMKELYEKIPFPNAFIFSHRIEKNIKQSLLSRNNSLCWRSCN